MRLAPRLNSATATAPPLKGLVQISAVPFRIRRRPCLAQCILIYGEHLAIQQQFFNIIGHRARVVAHQQRRRQNNPDRHVRAVLLNAYPAIAYLHHIGIVPVARTSIGFETVLRKAAVRHRLPVVLYIIGGAPQITAHLRGPFPHLEEAVL
jgi:hypothetical protein